VNKVYNVIGISNECFQKGISYFSFGSIDELAQKSAQVLKDDVGFPNEGENQHDSLNAPSEWLV
jgi:hypothetical protein